MSLTLTQLMPAAARATLIAERFGQYEVRAAVFLHQQLGWLVRDLDQAALGRAIGECYALSQDAGLRSEADHLKYLYAAAYWGIGFASDPQYAAPLSEAGYRPAEDGRAAYLPIEPVLNALERWQQPLRGEVTQPDAVLRALVGIAEAPPPDARQLTAWVGTIWPDRCRRLAPGQIAACLEAAAREYPMPDAALNGQAVYAAIALHLGSAFGRDPFLPVSAGAATDGFDLIHGLINYWKSFGRAAA